MDDDEEEASGDEEEDGDEDGEDDEEEDGPGAGMKLAACSVDFNVGFFSDRESGFEGISHFLEHMVFMGSEKYPGKVARPSSSPLQHPPDGGQAKPPPLTPPPLLLRIAHISHHHHHHHHHQASSGPCTLKP